jgi:hypothetical protein
MPFDRTKYNTLFPRDKKPAFDPISPTPVKTQADDILAAAPSASPSRTREALPITALSDERPTEESGFMGNMARQFGAGVVQVGEMGLGAAEYAARSTDLTDGIVADTIYSGRSGLAGIREDILAGISEEDRQKAAAEILTLDPNRTIWQGNPLEVAESVMYKVANALPATMVTMLPAIRYAKIGMSGKAVVAMGATEGTMSVGGIQNGIADEILGMGTEELMQESPRFNELLEANGGNGDEARQQLIQEAQGFAPLVGGATVAGLSAVAGRYFAPIFEKTGGAALGSRVGRGIAAEAPQEASQGASEQLVQNYAAKVYDADRQLSEGVAEAAAQEGLIGGVMGGGAAAAFGERPARPVPPAPEIDMDARPEITEQPYLPGFEPPEGATLPDELDQPTPEPAGDIQSQLNDMWDDENPRRAVFLAPGQERAGFEIPPGIEEYVFDDGSSLVAKDPAVIEEALARLDAGESRQSVLGSLTGDGTVKPFDPDALVVQLLDEQGNVTRESVVRRAEAETLGKEWSKEFPDRQIMITTPHAAQGRRQALGQRSTGLGVQEDLFDNQARGKEGVLVPPAPDQSQGELPLRDTRPRRERVQQPVTPTGVPGQQPLPEAGTPHSRLPQQEQAPLPDQGEIDRRQFGMDFREPVTETETTRTTRDVPTPDLAVQVISEEGEILEEQRYGSQEFAEEAADELAAQYPDYSVRVVPATRAETQVKTRAKVKPRGPVEPEYQGDITEEVRGDIRAEIPFEERAEPIAEVEGSRSVGQAADKLVSRAAHEFDVEQKQRIGGFYNPNRLSFADPEYEQAYKDAWGKAVDAELTIELSDDNYVKGQAKLARKAALKELAKVRQVARPKLLPGKSERFMKAAKAVNPAEVRNLEENVTTGFDKPIKEAGPKQPGSAVQVRDMEDEALGEFKPMTREEIDALEGRELDEEFERAVRYREGREHKIRRRKEKSRGRDLVDEGQVTFKPTKREKEEARLEEEAARERAEAVAASKKKSERAGETPTAITGQEATFEDITEEDVVDDTADELEGFQDIDVAPTDYRKTEGRTPGLKKKFIRREAEMRQRQESGQRTKKAPTVEVIKRQRDKKGKPKVGKKGTVLTSRSTAKTSALTIGDRPMDESVEGREQRELTAKEALAEVGKAATRAKKFLQSLNTKAWRDHLATLEGKKKTDALYAKKYLGELIQFARSIQKAGNDTKEAIKLAQDIAEGLNVLEDLDLNTFTQKWGPLARANEFEALRALRGTSLEAMRVPEKRKKTIAKTNTIIRNRNKLREVSAALREDDMYNRMILPTLRKMSESIISAVESNTGGNLYIPNEADMGELRFALNMNKDKYGEVRDWMKRSGFLFDENNNLTTFEATGDYLNIQAKSKWGKETPPPPTASNIDEQLTRGTRRKEAQAKEDTSAKRNAAALYDKVNGLIDRFQKATASSKTTISGIKRQEARFIRGLTKLGVWNKTGPNTGTININGFSSKTYVMVSGRVGRGKALSKPQALEVVRKVRQFTVPRGLKPFVEQVRTPEFAAGVERFLDENAIELFLDASKPIQYDKDYSDIAESIGQMVMEGAVNGADVVNAILEMAPQNSFYRNLATRLNRNDLNDVKVVFGTEADFPRGQFGGYKRKNNTVYLNREALEMGNLNGDEVLGARVVHTLTHELVHAQTHKAIDNSPRLKSYLEGLQRRAREVWLERIGGPLPYGLKVLEKTNNQAHEFVAEAFSDHEFQNFLKDTPREVQTVGDLWDAFKRAVREVLGLPAQDPQNSLFDAILLTEDVLFDDAGFGATAQGDLYYAGDSVLDPISSHVGELAQKSLGWWGNVKDKARNLMTFDQLYDAYGKYFTNGAFERYMDAFKRRNSAISKHMKVPEKLSTRWTELEATAPDAALELSRIGTEATVLRMTPSKELTAKERSETDPARLKEYDELRTRFQAMPQEAQDLYNDLRDYYKSVLAEETNLLLDASLRGILTKGADKVLSAAEYKEKFPRSVISELSTKDDLAAALKDIVPEAEINELVTNLQRMASLRSIGTGDYFPLMRYGDYTVYKEVKRPDKFFSDHGEAMAHRKKLLTADPTLDVGVYKEGDRSVVRVSEKEFWMFESKTEATKKARELGVSVEARMRRDSTGTAIESNAQLQTILTSLSGNPAAQAAIKNHYLQSLTDQSFRKHELKRKNRKGVNYDLQHRNLATYLKQSAYYRAQLEHGWRMGEALQEMQDFTRGRPDDDQISTEQLGRVYQNVVYRDRLTNDADEMNKMVRQGVNVTQFMMLTSPSYWMINATQPWLVTAPIMGGKYGMANSYAALKHAMGLVKTPLTKEAWDSKFGFSAFNDPVATEKAFNVVDQIFDHLRQSGDPRAEEYIELIDELRDINIIDINVLTELRQIAEGVEGKLGTKVLDASRILAHLTEVNNRVMTAIAAYNLAIQNGESKEAAQAYAADMVSQTQFNYSSENKPPLFQAGGPLKWAAPLMFQFMQWPQHMYALLIRNVRNAVKGESEEVRRQALKSLTGLLATHAAVGGATGMALQPIKWAFGMLMMAFGDEDEPYTFANAMNGRAFDNLIQEVSTELFGNKMGRAVASGLPTLIGTDLSARMSMGNLYFVDLRGDTAESVLGSLVASFGGATLNQAMNWGNALGKVAEGDIYRGAEQAMPKIFRDVMRAGRYYNEGLVNNAGDTVIDTKDFSFGEVFLQGIGFSPDEVSKYYQGQAAIKGAQGYARDRRDRLVKQFVEEGSSSEIIREVRDFNRAYPSLRITRSTLIRGARAQLEREGKYRRYGANIDDKEARDFERYGDPYK